MKRMATLLVGVLAGAQVHASDQPWSRWSELGAPFPALTEVGPQCTGGAVLDDGVLESGLRTPLVTDARYVQRFTPSVYPARIDQVCVCWLAGFSSVLMGFSAVAYDDNGLLGQPGTLLGAKSSAVAIPFAFTQSWNNVACTDLNLTVTSGSVYLGTQWSPSGEPDAFVCFDESLTTPPVETYRSSNGGFSWTPISQDFPEIRALGVRAEFTQVAPPPPPPPPAPPAAGGFTSTEFPGYQFWVRFAGTKVGVSDADNCLPLTVCVAAAAGSRVETFLRIIGPKPNGFLWFAVAKFNLPKTEIWARQLSTGKTNYYLLPAVTEAESEIPGFVDKEAFQP